MTVFKNSLPSSVLSTYDTKKGYDIEGFVRGGVRGLRAKDNTLTLRTHQARILPLL